MLSIMMYVLTFVMIAFVLVSAVVVHLSLGLHRRRGRLRRRLRQSDHKDRETLHEMIFNPPH
jgi:hypothetical protein